MTQNENQNREILTIKLEQGYPCSVDWSPDGTRLVVGDDKGGVQVFTTDGKLLWRCKKHSSDVMGVSWAPDGLRIASASDDRTIQVYDANSGEVMVVGNAGNGNWKVTWSPDSQQLAWYVKEEEKYIVRVYDANTGLSLKNYYGHKSIVRRVSWFPHGYLLASGTGDPFYTSDSTVRIWDNRDGSYLHTLKGHTDAIMGLSWSPDGIHLVSASFDSTLRIWDTETGKCKFVCKGHYKAVWTVDWSPNSQIIASGSIDHTLRFWDAQSGKEILNISNSDRILSVAFSPDGTWLASAVGNGPLIIWDVSDLTKSKFNIDFDKYIVQQAATVGLNPTASKTKKLLLTPQIRILPSALAQMHRLNIFPPLSLLYDLLELLAGQCQIESLKTLINANRGIQMLKDLHWPIEAHLGLIALLLYRLPPSEWKPPENTTPTQVRDAFITALSWDTMEPQPPAPPILLLRQATEMIDDRFLTLLDLLGPEAVAADPGLPLSLMHNVKKIPPLSISQRRCLGIRTGTPQMSGHSTGLTPGADRNQIGDIQMGPLRNDFTSLLPTQLALPPLVKMYRHLRNELLFRAREMAEPPRMRPTVILLDVSPSTFGPIEKITRLAAFTVAQSLRHAGLPAILLTNSDGIKEGQWLMELNHPADLVEIWLQRTLKTIPASCSLELARVLRAGMQENDGLEPIILVLSHPWFGAGEEIPPIKNMRGLFVQFPNYPTVPALSNQCEKWKTVEATQVNDLTSILAQLIT